MHTRSKQDGLFHKLLFLEPKNYTNLTQISLSSLLLEKHSLMLHILIILNYKITLCH